MLFIIRHFFKGALLLLCIFAFCPGAEAELRKEQVAVLANKASPEGIALARYYLQARGLTESQLLILDLPTNESIERDAYEAKVIAPLRAKLVERNLSGKIRVLVTTYGVPLRVLAPEAKGEEKQTLLEAITYRKAARAHLEKIEEAAFQLAKTELKRDEKSPESDQELISNIRQKIAQAAEQTVPEESKKQIRAKLTELLNQFGGLAALAGSIKVPEGSENEKAETALEKLKRDVESAQKLMQALDEARTPENRKRAYDLSSRVFGASGVLARASAQERLLEYKDADASFDSELSFLWFDREHYSLSERVPNPYAYQYLSNGKPPAFVLPLMLVSRIDGSSAAKAKQLIDFALQAEEKGLEGEAYVDARGLPASDKSYGDYDENLRQLGKLLKGESPFPVTVDNADGRLTSAKDTALYCGWYRLRHYEDVFTFRPGAIGYHIASEEAVSLHNPDETGWCKNAIDRGITVTLGAVAEPYLDSFPRPLEFFGLLLSGHYSLIEVYALTDPFVSWRMLLLGDPFYRPFHKELVTSEELRDRDERANSLNPFPPSPLEQSYEDPTEIHKKLKARHEALLKEIENFYSALLKRLNEKKAAQ